MRNNPGALGAILASSACLSTSGVTGFVPATQKRAVLESLDKRYASNNAVHIRSAYFASSVPSSSARGAMSMDLSSLENKLLDAPSKNGKFSLPSVKLPNVKIDVPDVKIPEVKSVSVPDVQLDLPDVSQVKVDLPPIELKIPPEVQSSVKSVLDAVSPQVQKLISYVAAELQTSWSAYVAKLTAGDSATITVTGWSALIVLLIGLNTAARSGANARKPVQVEKTPSPTPLKRGISLDEVRDVGKRIASGGGTISVGTPVPKSKPAPKPIAKKQPQAVKVVNPLAKKRSEILAAKSKSQAKKLPVVAKKAATKSFKTPSTLNSGDSGKFISDFISDFQAKNEKEQQQLIGAGIAALLLGGASLGGGGAKSTTPAPAPKPAKKSAPKPVTMPEPISAPAASPVTEPVPEPPEPIVESEPVPAPVPVLEPEAIVVAQPATPSVKKIESKIGKESVTSKLVEPIKFSSPSAAPARKIEAAPPALTMEPWYRKGMDEYLSENAAEGDVASNAPLIAAALLGLVATRSTMESTKEFRQQTQNAIDIIESMSNDPTEDETALLIEQLDAKIDFFRGDQDKELRTSLQSLRLDLLELQAKKKLRASEEEE